MSLVSSDTGSGLCLLDVNVCDDTGMVDDVLAVGHGLGEGNVLDAALHEPVTVHVHHVALGLVGQVLLHLGDVGHAQAGQFLKFAVVDIGPVHGHDVTAAIMRRGEHEAVVGGCRSELHVTWHALVGMDDGVYLDAAFLLTALGMAACALEDQVGEQRDRRGIENLEAFHPFCRATLAAVRGKFLAVTLVQVAVDGLEDALGPAGIRVRQGAALGHHADAQVSELPCLGQHAASDFAQRVVALDHRIEHDGQVLPHVKLLDVPLSTVFTADFGDFFLVKQINQLTKQRLSDKMCTFVHLCSCYLVFVVKTKVTKKAEPRQRDSA